MIYDAQARKGYKAQARADIRQKFWPTIGAVILASIPLALMSIIMSIGAEGFDTWKRIQSGRYLIRLWQVCSIQSAVSCHLFLCRLSDYLWRQALLCRTRTR